MKIEELTSSIKREEIVMPEFQREFVWNKARIRELVQSLLNSYPVGGILVWKTDNPPQLKGLTFKKDIETNRSYQVLLDGQQRSTALYMLITGELPPYYSQAEIIDDPRSLAFNLYTRELKYWNQKLMSNDQSWQLVTEIMQDKVKWYVLAGNIHKKFLKMGELANHIFDFDISDRARAYGEFRSLIESAGLQMDYIGGSLWKIFLPTKEINIKNGDLEKFYIGTIRGLGKSWGPNRVKWETSDHKIDKDTFLEFWHSKILAEANKLAVDHSDQDELMTKFGDNYSDLVGIKKLDIFRQDIPQSADFGAAIDIFDKINSQGVQLSQADLALTHITAIWPDARRRMKSYLTQLERMNFKLNLIFTTRLLILCACERASLDSLSSTSFEPIRRLDERDLEIAWAKCEDTFSYVVDVLRGEKITNSEIIKSKSVLLPMFYYALQSGGQFNSDDERRWAIYWLHNALIWGRYSASADQKLEEDINVIKNSAGNIWQGLLTHILDQRGRLTIEARDLEGSGTNGRFFNSYYVMLKHRGAKDWFTGVSLDSPEDSNFATNRHHIFPKALLRKSGFSEDNKIQRAIINELSNLAIITETTNIKISDKSPNRYIPDILENYPSSLHDHLIPDTEALWEVERYTEFLEQRRKAIAKAMNDFLNSYKNDKTLEKQSPKAELLWTLPESENLEFKESWQYDIFQSERDNKPVKNQKLQLSCIKTVAAFLNSSGGDLLVGVSNDNQISGLDRDMQFVDGSIDKLELKITQALATAIGVEKAPYYKITFPNLDGKVACHISVKANFNSKTWVNFGGTEAFYIRHGNSTRTLSGEEADQYWSERENVETVD
ncbi:DUF262 domain-containing protein [Paracoccaceae bacterium]|nr:DUF262 domain-containing protein [Paracoccaceae bacterium]